MSDFSARVGKIALDENTAKTLAVILLSVNPASEGMSGLSRLNYASTVLPALRDVASAYEGQEVEVIETDGDVKRFAKLTASNLVKAVEAVITAMSARETFDSLVSHWSEGTKSRGRIASDKSIALNIPLPAAK